MAGYPIELELRDKRALVVGLGPVGRRKVAGLVAAGARVVVVDPAADRLAAWPAEVEICAELYRSEHLQGMTLAFAAASATVNRTV
ncbi:NAD(P)-dependent oxidoreductase, partial [Singulisphaera acidiphila]